MICGTDTSGDSKLNDGQYIDNRKMVENLRHAWIRVVLERVTGMSENNSMII